MISGRVQTCLAPAKWPRQAVHVLDTPSAASSTADWSSHLQTPEASKIGRSEDHWISKAQPSLQMAIDPAHFKTWPKFTDNTWGKSNINNKQLYVLCWFRDLFSNAPFPHPSTGLLWSPMVSFEALVEERFAINLLGESGPQFAWFQADPRWFLRISALPYLAIPCL